MSIAKSKTSRKVINSALSAVLALTITVWLGGFAFVAPRAEAQSLADSIAAIQAQIAALTAQLNSLLASSGSTSTTVGGLTKNLSQGVTDPEVSTLQSGLKQDPSVYPEGLVTGYFGGLTRAAVIRFQEKYASEVLAPVGLSSGTGFVGSSTRAKFNALYAGTGTGTGSGPVVPTGSQILVSLAANTPAAGVAPKLASNVQFLAVNLTAPLSGAVRVDSIIVHRAGAGSPSDFDNVYLYEGDTRLTTGRSVNSSTNNAEFHSLNLNINAGQTRTIWVTADLATGAGAGNQNYFEIVSASSVVGSASVAGAFPIRGNAVSVANASAGQVTLDQAVDGTNPKVGEKNRSIGSFRVTASSTEDVELRRIALFQAGSVSRSALQNMKLRYTGTDVASVAGVNDKDLAVFVFTTPFLIEKGNSRTFEIFVDVAAGAKNNDTIKLYVDEKTDVYAVGRTYGRGVAVVNTALDGSVADTDEVDVTIEGGQLTITFNGPAAKDLAPDAEDVELYNFTLAAGVNLEVRDLALAATSSVNINDFDDFKIVNVTKGIVVMGPTDTSADASAANITFTDRFTMNAGETNVFSVRADVAPTADVIDGQTVRVTLGQGTGPFGSNSVRNLDNNQFISDIVPSGDITGNTHTIRATALTLSLAGTPTSQSFVRGTGNVDMVGFNFKAGVAQDITLTSIKVTGYGDDDTSGIFSAGILFGASSSTVSGRTNSVWLVDQSNGSTVAGPEAVNSTTGEAQFSSMNFTVPAGQTKTLVVRSNLDASALANSNTDRIKFDIAAVGDVVARDPQGNSVSVGSAAPNSTTADSGTRISVVDTGSISVALAPDDTESEAGLVVAGKSNVVIAKYRYTAQNEELKVTKVQFSVASGALDEVTQLSVWDGSSMLASITPTLSGSSGSAAFTNLNFVVPKDASKTLTVKANLNTTSAGADTGDEIQAVHDQANFEARGTAAGSSTVLTSSGVAATGLNANTKYFRKTVPTITFAAGDALLTTGEKSLMKITIAADASEQVSVRSFEFTLSVSNATFDTTNDNFKVRESGNLLTSTSTNTQAAANITLTSESTIPAGGSKTYEILGTVTGAGTGSASVTIKMEQSTTEVGPSNWSAVNSDAGTLDLVWSDNSAIPHGLTSADWYNGFKVKNLPSGTMVLSKN
ncbi:peptidoglycan-binding protein [Candidatus Parcubacteria bacterium]|nr:MAG: peptidoglycan-binding protein [Candidatus Parcubacteria bacterium]